MSNPIVFAIKEMAKTITVVVAALVSQGALVVVRPWCGVALNAITQDDLDEGEAGTGAAYLGLDVSECQVDLDAASEMFTAVGAEVWLSSAGAFAATGATGSYLVGYCTIPCLAADPHTFRFEKLRKAVPFTEIVLADISDLDELEIEMAQVTDLDELKFEDLADVAAVAPTNNDTLKFVTSTHKWTTVAVTD